MSSTHKLIDTYDDEIIFVGSYTACSARSNQDTYIEKLTQDEAEEANEWMI